MVAAGELRGCGGVGNGCVITRTLRLRKKAGWTVPLPSTPCRHFMYSVGKASPQSRDGGLGGWHIPPALPFPPCRNQELDIPLRPPHRTFFQAQHPPPGKPAHQSLIVSHTLR